jgi:hypothetical protein
MQPTEPTEGPPGPALQGSPEPSFWVAILGSRCAEEKQPVSNKHG